MYDKIELLVSAGYKNWDVSLEDMANALDYDRRTISRIKNFSLIEKNINQILMRGSLAKFYHGENITPLSFMEVKPALDKLGKLSGYDLRYAKVISLEFGISIMVKRPACEYLKLFGNCKYFKRMDVYNQTGKFESVIYLNRKGRQKFIVYDKVAEMNKNQKRPNLLEMIIFIACNKNIQMKDKRFRIPDLYKDSDVLRLEYSLKKGRIQEIFGRDLSVYDLTDYKVYRTLQQRFYKFYRSISKTGRIVFISPSSMEKKTNKEFEKLALEQLKQLEPNEYNFLLQDTQAKELLPSYTLNRIRAKDRYDSNDYNISYTNDLIEELNALIKLKMSKIA